MHIHRNANNSLILDSVLALSLGPPNIFKMPEKKKKKKKITNIRKALG